MRSRPLWTPERSIALSLVCAWVALLLCAAVAVTLTALPWLHPRPGTLLADLVSVGPYRAPLYAGLAVGAVALVTLLRLLGDIRHGHVFTPALVGRLRLISYCGLVIGLIGLIAAVLYQRLAFLVVGLAAGLFALLIRVLKNVMEAARLLQEDADLTV